MKRILKWLKSKFSQRSAAVGADERHTSVGVRVKPKDIAKKLTSFWGEVLISLHSVDKERSVFYETNV